MELVKPTFSAGSTRNVHVVVGGDRMGLVVPSIPDNEACMVGEDAT